MSYQRLVQNALRSGEYRAEDTADKEEGDFQDAGALRAFIRSKMEWIAAREAYDVKEPCSGSREGSSMKLAQYVKFREEKFGGVLFETRSEKVFTLSPTGAAVVREIAAGGDSQAVMERLKARYQDSQGAMEKEATEFIAQLKTQGLVTE